MGVTETKLKKLNGTVHDRKVIKISDRDGLYIFHLASGKLTFTFRYQWNGKSRDLRIGGYPALSLTQAREKALEFRKMLALGQEPSIQQRLQKNAVVEAVTVQQALEHWLQGYALNNRTNHDKHRAQFIRHIYPRIGDLPLEQVDTHQWVAVFDAISSGTYYKPAPKASGYILMNCKQALKYCRVRQFAASRALDDLNIADIGEGQDKGDRVLSRDELMDLLGWCGERVKKAYYRNLVYLLVHFGCRTGELRLSKVGEWDLDSMIWTIPKQHSKSNVEIKRPIPEALKNFLSNLINASENGYLLGDLKQSEAVSQYGRLIYRSLDHDKWTLHDLRRTFATALGDLRVEPYIVEQLLGHSLGGVLAIYNRSHHIKAKRQAMDVWTQWLTDSFKTLDPSGQPKEHVCDALWH
ncbi:site-specific integrase [uncultured Ferrimonas sp.]|uniref:tyrosine-type recombinase/integrase n=1 Tax=uncultured Ferrimonas sp. TaxID=432640 RepID=UPI00262CA1BA|nr:site-specific integrase [uncultured Ferrimonas sp.]